MNVIKAEWSYSPRCEFVCKPFSSEGCRPNKSTIIIRSTATHTSRHNKCRSMTEKKCQNLKDESPSTFVKNPTQNKKYFCSLVGAGPGSIDYLTMKASKLISEADIIIYDDLGTKDALSLARPGTDLVYVGKRGGRRSINQDEINQIIIEKCKTGRRVVRLKGGCPSVFSRVHSEVAALVAADITFEFIPGVSSVLSAPLLAGIPLTLPQDRQYGSNSYSRINVGKPQGDVKNISPTFANNLSSNPNDKMKDKNNSLPPPASSFSVVSGHEVSSTNWVGFRDTPTLVVLMGGRVIKEICEKLRLEAGWAEHTPLAIIRSAGVQSTQKVWKSTIGSIEKDLNLAEDEKLSPCVIVIGRAVSAAM